MTPRTGWSLAIFVSSRSDHSRPRATPSSQSYRPIFLGHSSSSELVTNPAQRNETNKQAKSLAMGRNWWSLRAELRLRNARVENDSVWDWQTILSGLKTIPSGKHFSERPLRLSNTVGLLLLWRQFFKTQSERKTEPNISRSMTWLHEYWICQESIRLIVEHIPKSSTIPKTFLEAWIDDKKTGANFK